MSSPEVLQVMNSALEGSGFHLDEDLVFRKGEKTCGLYVFTGRRGRVQVRATVGDALYWSGAATNIREFTRAFWFSA